MNGFVLSVSFHLAECVHSGERILRRYKEIDWVSCGCFFSSAIMEELRPVKLRLELVQLPCTYQHNPCKSFPKCGCVSPDSLSLCAFVPSVPETRRQQRTAGLLLTWFRQVRGGGGGGEGCTRGRENMLSGKISHEWTG